MAAGGCGLDTSLLLIDLQQWALLDMVSRVEYWMALNLRVAHPTANAAPRARYIPPCTLL